MAGCLATDVPRGAVVGGAGIDGDGAGRTVRPADPPGMPADGCRRRFRATR